MYKHTKKSTAGKIEKKTIKKQKKHLRKKRQK